jgi:hypothetical protein
LLLLQLAKSPVIRPPYILHAGFQDLQKIRSKPSVQDCSLGRGMLLTLQFLAISMLSHQCSVLVGQTAIVQLKLLATSKIEKIEFILIDFDFQNNSEVRIICASNKQYRQIMSYLKLKKILAHHVKFQL